MPEDDVPEWVEEIKEAIDSEPDLEPTGPDRAFDLWMKQQQDSADSTLQSYRYRVRPLLNWLEEQGIHNLNEVTTRHVKEWQAQRRENRDRQTLNNQWGTVRQFLQYCYELNAVSEDVIKAVSVPNLSKEDRVNTEKLIADRAEKILDNLNRYEYATREHVLFLLLWRTTMRIGAIYALDLQDVYLDEEDRSRLREELEDEGFAPHVVDGILEDVVFPIVYPRHRPDQGTPLKNKQNGERVINIKPWVGSVVEDYLCVNRHDLQDEFGRRPLLTSNKGSARLSKSAMRNWIYMYTQPCEFGDLCPHDRDPEGCEAREHGYGSLCPSSRSPHRIRTGAITNHRDQGWSIADLADKANTSEELIEGVYDQPEELIRGAHRRSNLQNMDSERGASDGG